MTWSPDTWWIHVTTKALGTLEFCSFYWRSQLQCFVNAAQVFEVKSSTSAQDLNFFFLLNKIRRAFWSSFFSELRSMTHFVGGIVTSEAGSTDSFPLFLHLLCATAWLIQNCSGLVPLKQLGWRGRAKSLKRNGKNSIIAFVVWRLKNYLRNIHLGNLQIS